MRRKLPPAKGISHDPIEISASAFKAMSDACDLKISRSPAAAGFTVSSVPGRPRCNLSSQRGLRHDRCKVAAVHGLIGRKVVDPARPATARRSTRSTALTGVHRRRRSAAAFGHIAGWRGSMTCHSRRSRSRPDRLTSEHYFDAHAIHAVQLHPIFPQPRGSQHVCICVFQRVAGKEECLHEVIAAPSRRGCVRSSRSDRDAARRNEGGTGRRKPRSAGSAA